jgi:protein-serine/threonine kinase
MDVWSSAIVYINLAIGGGTWNAAKPEDPHYRHFAEAWDAWEAKHPEHDGHVNDLAGGAPTCGYVFTQEMLGTPGIKRMILKMMNPDPAKRVTIREVLNSPLMRGVECCCPEGNDTDESGPSEGAKLERSTTGDCLVNSKKWSKTVLRKHNHVPPKEHKTPQFFVHR